MAPSSRPFGRLVDDGTGHPGRTDVSRYQVRGRDLTSATPYLRPSGRSHADTCTHGRLKCLRDTPVLTTLMNYCGLSRSLNVKTPFRSEM